MIKIRRYQINDSIKVGKLIAKTYSEFNLQFASDKERKKYLGPFQYAKSKNKIKQKEIAKIISADIVLVAEADNNVVGILRGKPSKLQSLFVYGKYHRKGIGRELVKKFEGICSSKKTESIKLMSTVYAIPFYEAMGYKKTTGVRKMKSFDGKGLPYQPMKKIL